MPRSGRLLLALAVVVVSAALLSACAVVEVVPEAVPVVAAPPPKPPPAPEPPVVPQGPTPAERRATALSTLAKAAARLDRAGASAVLGGLPAESPEAATAPLALATRSWIDAKGAAEDLRSFDALIAAARSEPAVARLLTALGQARTALRDHVAASVPKLRAFADTAGLSLRCADSGKAGAQLGELETALQAPRSRLKNEGCAETEAAASAAVKERRWEDAYEAWYGFMSRNGARPYLDPPILKKQAKAFGVEMKATVAELSGTGLKVAQLPKRKLLRETPVAVLWEPTLALKLKEIRGGLAAKADAAQAWGGLAEVAPVLPAIDEILADSGSVPPPEEVASLVADAKKGKFVENASGWKGLVESGSDSLHRLAARAKSLAAGDLASGAAKLGKQKKFVEAAQALKAALELDASSAQVQSQRAALAGSIAGERDKLLATLRAATQPAPVLAALKKLEALDLATDGPGSKVSEASRKKFTGAVTGFAGGKQDQVYLDIRPLEPAGVDYLQDVAGKLRGWVRPWGIAAATKGKNLGEFVAAEKVALEVEALAPGDPQIAALLASLKEPARAQRTARVEGFFKGGKIALGYLMTRVNRDMTEADRRFVLDAHALEITALRAKLKLVGVLQPADAFSSRLAQSLVSAGANWEIVAMPPFQPPLHPIAIRVRALRLDMPPPQVIRTEQGSSHYLAGQQMVMNPAKNDCNAAVATASSELASAQNTVNSLQYQYEQCMAQSAQLASQGGWAQLAGGLGGAACEGIMQSSKADANNAQAKFNSTQASCAAVPAMINEERWGDMAYTIEQWGADPSVEVELAVENGLVPGRVVVTKKISHRFHLEDRVVRGQPQFNIPDDPMQLPQQSEVERQLLEAVVAQARPALAAALPEFWKELDASAQAEQDAVSRKELLAQIAVIAEGMMDRADLQARAKVVATQIDGP